MTDSDSTEHIVRFVHKLLGTGMMLSELASDLIEALPADAYPEEEEPGAWPASERSSI